MNKKKLAAAIVIIILAFFAGVMVPPVEGHPMKRPQVELYWAHRCNENSTAGIKACIHRAAIHWEVPAAIGYKIASHETGADDSNSFNPNICNWEGSGACGLFQFMLSTYNYTPYDTGCGDRFVAKCASLAWAWLWHLGQYSHWRGAY